MLENINNGRRARRGVAIVSLWAAALIAGGADMAAVSAMHSPSVPPHTATAASAGAHEKTCPSQQPNSGNNIFGGGEPSTTAFGVSRRVPSARAMLKIRGGQVHEPTTLEDVEALLMKAGSEQKLVVIDFSATWYVQTCSHLACNALNE